MSLRIAACTKVWYKCETLCHSDKLYFNVLLLYKLDLVKFVTTMDKIKHAS